MSEILIKGLEMPKDDILRIEICPNEQVNRIIGWALSEMKRGKAIEVPPHGRLIQAEEVKKLLNSGLSLDTYEDQAYVCSLIDEIPTIIEASKERE